MVGEEEADVRLVTAGRGDSRVHIDIIVHGQVVEILCGNRDIFLTDEGVDEPVDIGAVVVILLGNQAGGIDTVHPGGNVCDIVIDVLSRTGVEKHCPDDVSPSEEADGASLSRANPPRLAIFINFQMSGTKHIGGIMKAQEPIQVPVKVLGRGVAHAIQSQVRQANHIGLLGDHIYRDIGGQPFLGVKEPFEKVSVLQGSHSDRPSLIIDLGVILRDVKLADHVGQFAQLPVPQHAGRGFVQHGDLVIGHRFNIGGKISRSNIQQLVVSTGAENGGR